VRENSQPCPVDANESEPDYGCTRLKLDIAGGFLRFTVHCVNCHGDDHRSCYRCGVCILAMRKVPGWRYWKPNTNRWYCSTTCRVNAWKARQATVTDNGLAPVRTTVTRNATADPVDAEVRRGFGDTRAGRCRYEAWKSRVAWGDNALSGPVPRTDDEWATYLNRSIIIGSIDAAEFCANCERDIEPDEFVERRELGYSSWRRGSPPTHGGVLCEDCSTADPLHRRDCEGCGRPTVDRSRHRWVYDPGIGPNRRTFCSRRCKDAHYRHRRQHRLAEERAQAGPHRCADCDEIMDGQRSDARYCSSACRQRAYRARRRDEPDDA
jgi:hypothetical protein